MSSLLVVVCLPLSSFLSPDVCINSLPARQFISVDLPTPDEPMKEAVSPFFRCLKTCLHEFLSWLLVTITSVPTAIADISPTTFERFSHRSDFVNIMTTFAPLFHATERYLSRRLKL